MLAAICHNTSILHTLVNSGNINGAAVTTNFRPVHFSESAVAHEHTSTSTSAGGLFGEWSIDILQLFTSDEPDD